MKKQIKLVCIVLFGIYVGSGCEQLSSPEFNKENDQAVEKSEEKPTVQVEEINKGINPKMTTAENTVGRLVRYPAEEKRWLEMDSDTAYARDVLAGGETFISDAEDGETWGVEFELPGDTAIVPGGPVEFHESYDDRENCFVSSGFISCGSRSLLIRWSLTVQGQTTGEWDIRFINNDTPYETKSFYLKPQIPPGKVPAGSAFNQGTYSETPYDGICKGPLDEDGDPIPVACNETYSEPFTIQRKGCYITAGAMIIAYHGGDVDIKELNSWLNENGGYDSYGNAYPGKIAEYGTKVAGVNMSWVGNTDDVDEEKLKHLLFNYGPQIVGTKLTSDGDPTHWIAATGQNKEETTLLINDPDGGGITTVANKYDNNWSDIRAFSGPENEITDKSGITIRFHSPGELVLTDPVGRRVGYDPINSTSYDEIPSAGYSEQGLVDDSEENTNYDNDPSLFHEIEIMQPADGEYRLEVIGTGTGKYSLDMLTIGSDFDDVLTTFKDLSISPDEIHSYEFNFSKEEGSQTAIEGGYDGAGQRPRDVNKFLSFASPTEAQTDLPEGTTTYALHVFYGKDVLPESFSAELNRSDISEEFDPQPGTHEVVNLNLKSGRNVVQLSVDGELPNRIANDKDRLVLKVE